MAATGTHNAGEHKCATCRFWGNEDRRITFVKYKPTYVVCPAGEFPCLAQRGRDSKAVDHCAKWDLWEKLL